MSKLAKAGKAAATKAMKNAVDQKFHPPYLSTIIPAGLASPAPPLGAQLGQVFVHLGHSCM